MSGERASSSEVAISMARFFVHKAFPGHGPTSDQNRRPNGGETAPTYATLLDSLRRLAIHDLDTPRRAAASRTER